MADPQAVILAIREPGGRAERTIYDLSLSVNRRYQGRTALIDCRKRRDLEGLLLIPDLSEQAVEDLLGDVNTDWADDLEIIYPGRERLEKLLAAH